jgi:hypothetical protein
MTKPNFEQDPNQQRLVNFLKQHRPTPPPARIDLEQSILSQISTYPLQKTVKQSRFQKLWLVPVAIAASLFLGWRVEQQMHQPVMSEAERTNVESALVATWAASSGEEVEELTASSLIYGDPEIASDSIP